MSRPEIVAAARAWVGTPYRHQASVKGAGADCLGLIRGVWRDALGTEPEQPPAYSRDWGEVEAEEVLWRAAARHLTEKPRGEAAPGDVLLFRMKDGSVAKHLGILAEPYPASSFVHAYQGHGVLESPLSAPWERRIVACFAFPERSS